MTNAWMKYKSGTDIRGFGTYGDDATPFLSDEAVAKMAAGFAGWLSEKLGYDACQLFICVGGDSRVSTPRIRSAVIDSLLRLGVCVADCGLSSTPAMFMTTVDLNCHGAIQITASHHPMEKNGLKFFTSEGGLDSEDITDILRRAEKTELPAHDGQLKAQTLNFMDRYSEILREMICRQVNAEDYLRPLKGFKIAVDAGNGAGGFYAENVLAVLGADVSGSCFLEPDGTFPNHIPNPENSNAMRAAVLATTSSNSDLGIIFDTDVDRAGCVSSDGEEINTDALIAVAASIALEECPGGTIVTDSVTSDGLAKFIADAGGVHLRFKRGYKNIINEQHRLIDSGISCPLAIETSGHASFSENYCLDDGAYLITKIIIKMAKLKRENKTLQQLIASLERPVESNELRFKIDSDDFREYGNQFIDGWSDFASQLEGWSATADNHEGIRFSTDVERGDGWILTRLSVHDPVIVINTQSNSDGGCQKMLERLKEFTSGFEKLDTGAFA